MLTKFFKRGGTDDDRRTLGGSAVKHYLLGSDDQPREKARLLLGDPDEVTEIINGLPFAKVYSSGCLSFHEKDLLTDAQKFEIIEDFEAMMFVGLQPHQYTSYWVEHTDKGRVELNFVFPNVELISGNHLQVYYHYRDLALVNSWKDLTNDRYGFVNPADLNNRRDVTPSMAPNIVKDWATSDKQSIIDKLKRFTEVEDIKNARTDLVLTQSELRRQQGKPLKGQDDIADMLTKYGFEISRQGKDSISIKNPDPTKKNIKLKGVIYERDATESVIRYVAERKGADPAANQISADDRAKQLRQAAATFSSELEKRRERHYQRYDENLRAARALSRQQSKLKRQPSKAASKLAQSDLSDLGERQTDLAWGVDANRSAQAADQQRLSAYPNPLDEAEQSITPSHNPRDTNHPTASPTPTANPASADGRASPSGYRDDRVQPTAKQGADWATSTQQTEPRDRHGQPIGGTATADGDISTDQSQPVPGLAGNQGLSRPKSKRTKLTQSTNQSYPDSIPSPSPYRYPAGLWRWYQYYPQISQQRRMPKKWLWLSDALYQPKPVLPSQLETNNHATHYHTAAHYQALKRAVERFAQPSEPDAQPTPSAAIPDNRRDGTKTSGIDVAQLVSAAINSPNRASKPKDRDAQPADHPILGRIKQATDCRNSNTEKRTRRISALAGQDSSHLDQFGQRITARRQRSKKLANQLTQFDNQLTDTDGGLSNLTTGYDKQTNRFIQLNRRIRKVKRGYGFHAHGLQKSANQFKTIIGAVSAVVKAVIALFKKLFNGLKQQVVGYAKEGLLHHANSDGSMGRQATTKEAESFVDSHPYDLSGYAQLTMTAKKLEKDKELRHEPFRGFGR